LPTSLFRWIWGWKSGIPAGSRRRLLGRPLLRSTPVEAHLKLSYRCIDVIFFGPKGHFIINKYLYYWTWNLFIILLLYVWMKHPRHTYGGFVPTFSERGMTISHVLRNHHSFGRGRWSHCRQIPNHFLRGWCCQLVFQAPTMMHLLLTIAKREFPGQLSRVPNGARLRGRFSVVHSERERNTP
jgi:hypothetical protein